MKIYNFSAGPACLNESVLSVASEASLEYKDSGMSLLEMSHRSKEIVSLFEETTENLQSLLSIPSNYKILWLQGGASLQFPMIPMNLISKGGSADYIDTGSWSSKAINECNKLETAITIASSSKSNYSFIPKQFEQNIESNYLHITSNNTIYGTQYKDYPEVINPNGFLVADMSSDILSKPINVSDFGLIYAGAQKNMGPAGVTLVIIRDDLVGKNYRDIPTMLNYETHVKKESMFNTPPVFSVFVVNETLKWLQNLGGLEAMAEINEQKSKKLYDEIERNSLFKSPIVEEDRSLMNVPFIFDKEGLDDKDFLQFCHERGLRTLKGHRSVGGFRASIYNAMPELGVDTLIAAMKEYEEKIVN
ncbi:MAG: 3-phosphoserine/phosphohydroxythreonine transaminase [Candidatus Marinimicrobia bacterium]|jgi:phosphoserine aminotransferase|nr:3-phosphoserine/phosphohydroxythreonine transaminase [Candidatus Neomarinimicrobiota bacterium]MBT3998656.1 3-phosphoserine/phosphohydroxythreonine transaminase [Candidatus Neomarinimicrobiota bacterium]MBT4282884.1 3-phosphoserine/phosphohydroxythreonine transaminase [Candidatus Neomarinimicrobiota bacterium]MBT4578483.1 3-phosphoserine/phosphohydroxythreonine transaminase [Candidatus Neomarinimicrobiota bacterium]MBT4957612.1 3-phosphoserine/phosphohydroxythreonine transaminase [Candidatus